jgi:hypothetical protein
MKRRTPSYARCIPITKQGLDGSQSLESCFVLKGSLPRNSWTYQQHLKRRPRAKEGLDIPITSHEEEEGKCYH